MCCSEARNRDLRALLHGPQKKKEKRKTPERHVATICSFPISALSVGAVYSIYSSQHLTILYLYIYIYIYIYFLLYLLLALVDVIFFFFFTLLSVTVVGGFVPKISQLQLRRITLKKKKKGRN